MYLTKSDFKLAQTCPTKLFYKKSGYPSTKEENKYLQLLAEGGFMVEKLAKLLFSEGREIGFDGSAETAFDDTQAALAAGDATLFEATLISGGNLARVDILRKVGSEFHLIEVKAKSYDSREDQECRRKGYRGLFWTKQGGIDSEWQEYLEDVAYQVLVLEKLYPGYRVRPFLLMPDKSKTTPIEGLHSMFHLRRMTRGRMTRYDVEFNGDLEELRANHFLTQVPIDGEVAYLREDVASKAEQYIASLAPTLRKLSVPLSTTCAGCEYRASVHDMRDGYRECWGKLADVKPHILDLWYAGAIGGYNGITTDNLIQSNAVNLLDVPVESLLKKDGTRGPRGDRQHIQIEHTRDNTEWISPGLAEKLQALEYPLNFIDFETTALAIPYHAGMRPYESVAFQWSCHTIAEPGAAPVHSEWINVTDVFPNFAFAESLMNQIGTKGTVFRYAFHETTILRSIRSQMDARSYRNVELARWLEEMSAKDRMVDMYRLTLENYYHPLMKGKNSIKAVVEAIWKTNADLRAAFPQYVRVVDGEILSPYTALPSLEIQGQPVTVAEGTGAMRAYEAMMYGLEKDNATVKQAWQRLLLRYCQLDTGAMIMLWRHWAGTARSHSRTRK